MKVKYMGQKAKNDTPILVLGTIVAGLLAAVLLSWRAILKQKQDTNDWKGIDKRDTEAR